ncbi:hypothetical protein phiV141_30 [Vibrio phage phiV141]|uniref:Uncharacterized protein n=1 Tax=Vibrio phage phiV141 TaxID=2723905 RepID=A0A7D7FA74_9CAUD|nr:hypothetical protein phiV141_30 [Vibrio phage phiV141]
MGAVKDLWDDVTGKTAQREAQEQARKDQIQAQNNAAKQRVFAETEGQGQGSVGEVSLGIDDELLDDDVKRKSNLYM